MPICAEKPSALRKGLKMAVLCLWHHHHIYRKGVFGIHFRGNIGMYVTHPDCGGTQCCAQIRTTHSFPSPNGYGIRWYLTISRGMHAVDQNHVINSLNCYSKMARLSHSLKPRGDMHDLWRILRSRGSHFAFLGHPTVSDSRYSSVATFGSDLQLCPRRLGPS